MPLPPVNPWLGFLLVVLGVGTAALFAHMKIDNAILPAAIVTAGLAFVQAAAAHRTTKELGQTRTELTTLKASMRPPSLVDPSERKSG